MISSLFPKQLSAVGVLAVLVRKLVIPGEEFRLCPPSVLSNTSLVLASWVSKTYKNTWFLPPETTRSLHFEEHSNGFSMFVLPRAYHQQLRSALSEAFDISICQQRILSPGDPQPRDPQSEILSQEILAPEILSQEIRSPGDPQPGRSSARRSLSPGDPQLR